jgi:hypothetical protein
MHNQCENLGQADLFGDPAEHYPLYPGSKDNSLNSPSRKAAEVIALDAKTLRARAFRCVANSNGLTADEVAAEIGASILATRPRIAELRRLGLVAATDARRPSSTGTMSTVWRAVRGVE